MNSRSDSHLKLFALTLISVVFGCVLSAQAAASGEGAVYRVLKPDQFMKRWLVVKPIGVMRQNGPPDEPTQKKAFARDYLASGGGEAAIEPRDALKQKLGEQELTWKLVESAADIVDLKSGSDPSEYSIAYAYAEVDMPKATSAVLGVGSDDAVKVWLNGKLVHEHWVDRPCQVDADVVPVRFIRGKNRLLFKIQNIGGLWGFCCRVMSEQTQAQKLLALVQQGSDPEALNQLLDDGINVNSRNSAGLTAAQAARLRGDAELVQFLATRGAETNAELPALRKTVDALFQDAIKPDGPGAAVLVARDGKIVFEKAYGLADIQHHVPVTLDTKFRIGSISKQFTAAAVLKLQEQGKVSVEDKLSKYFPDFPRGGEVTLRHLLTHTSGIHNYTSKSGFIDSVTKPITPEALVKSFQNDAFDFDPGKKWSYCNSGFFLLGCIVEKVSGQPYEDFLRKTFFEPLGMKNTGVHHSDSALRHVALGYNGGPERAVNWDMTWAGGAGALYSTVEDLYRWNEAVFHGKVLTETSLAAAFKPVKTTANQDDNPDSGYGYGWGIGKFRGATEISHGGGLNGFTSFLLRLPGKNFTVAVLLNGAPNAAPQTLAHTATELCLGTELDPRPKPVRVASSALALLTGRYDYGEAVLIVEQQGDHLFAKLGMQPRYEIFPKSDTDFFWKVVDAQVQFVKGPEGKIVEAVHRQNGAIIHAPRLPELAVIQVDPAGYDALVGSYKVENSDTVGIISRDGAHLFGQIAGQPRVELFPKSPTDFGVREVNAEITFVKDTTGKVTKIKVLQAGQTTEASKVK